MKSEINRFLKFLLDEGFIFERKVRKASNSSGGIFVPKELIGKRFRVLLMPAGPEDSYKEKIEQIEYNTKVLIRLIEKAFGKKLRTLIEDNKDEFMKIREEIKLENSQTESEEESEEDNVETNKLVNDITKNEIKDIEPVDNKTSVFKIETDKKNV